MHNFKKESSNNNNISHASQEENECGSFECSRGKLYLVHGSVKVKEERSREETMRNKVI